MSKNDPIPSGLRDRIKRLADELGVSEGEALDQAVSHLESELALANGKPEKSAYEILKEIGAIGCIEGPGDKSTNPKYFDDFGRA